MGLFSKILGEKPITVDEYQEQKRAEAAKPVKWKFEAHELEYDPEHSLYVKYFYDDVSIAGVRFRCIDYKALKNESLDLVPEPDNDADPKAVRVEQDGQHLGYLPANRLQEMYYSHLAGDNFPSVSAKLIEVDEKQQKLIMALEFINLYLDGNTPPPTPKGYPSLFKDDGFSLDDEDPDEASGVEFSVKLSMH